MVSGVRSAISQLFGLFASGLSLLNIVWLKGLGFGVQVTVILQSEYLRLRLFFALGIRVLSFLFSSHEGF